MQLCGRVFGVSPLHSWIRFLEFVLSISYRMEIQKWHIKDDDKIQMSERKQKILRIRWGMTLVFE